MPFKSDAQRKFFNSPGAIKAGIKPATIKEFNTASKGIVLPKFTNLKKRLKGTKNEY